MIPSLQRPELAMTQIFCWSCCWLFKFMLSGQICQNMYYLKCKLFCAIRLQINNVLSSLFQRNVQINSYLWYTYYRIHCMLYYWYNRFYNIVLVFQATALIIQWDQRSSLEGLRQCMMIKAPHREFSFHKLNTCKCFIWKPFICL